MGEPLSFMRHVAAFPGYSVVGSLAYRLHNPSMHACSVDTAPLHRRDWFMHLDETQQHVSHLPAAQNPNESPVAQRMSRKGSKGVLRTSCSLAFESASRHPRVVGLLSDAWQVPASFSLQRILEVKPSLIAFEIIQSQGRHANISGGSLWYCFLVSLV